jgi:hypothetical protein
MKNIKTGMTMNELLEFNDWVDGLIEDLAMNENVSLLEFENRFNQIESERERVLLMLSKINDLLDDNDFS